MPKLTNDSILWYNVGEFGRDGYAVFNWSDDIGTLNPFMFELHSIIGKNLFYMMHHEDVDMAVPPSINTLKRVHNLVQRGKKLIESHTIPHGQQMLETSHTTPAGEIWRAWPVPYFNVRNRFMKGWCHWILVLLAEISQFTENRREVETTDRLKEATMPLLDRVYRNMAMDVFQKTTEEVSAPDFKLQQADFEGYRPDEWFTETELVDTVPDFTMVFTEDRLKVFEAGIPVTELPPMTPYPHSLVETMKKRRNGERIGTNSGASSNTARQPGEIAIL